jgi:hypothetical protein
MNKAFLFTFDDGQPYDPDRFAALIRERYPWAQVYALRPSTVDKVLDRQIDVRAKVKVIFRPGQEPSGVNWFALMEQSRG